MPVIQIQIPPARYSGQPFVYETVTSVTQLQKRLKELEGREWNVWVVVPYVSSYVRLRSGDCPKESLDFLVWHEFNHLFSEVA